MQHNVFLEKDFYMNICIFCHGALIYASVGDIFSTSFITIHVIFLGKKTEKKVVFFFIIKLYNCAGSGLSRSFNLTSKLLMVWDMGANPWRERGRERENIPT